MILETNRLTLRRFTTDDAAFILKLLNEPSFIYYIGDKGVRSQDEACRYLESGPMDSYERFGFGLYCVELKQTGEPIGMCGLLKRETLPDPDLGFAFLPAYWANGYAVESAAAVLKQGQNVFGLKAILAITSPDNAGSQRVLQKTGFRPAGRMRLTSEASEICLFTWEATPTIP